ncbi:hypothetical protein [Bacillus atrophaeus]
MDKAKENLYLEYRKLMKQAREAKDEGNIDLCVELCLRADDVLSDYLSN